MATSKKNSDLEEKELLDIVLDMLIKDQSKEEILKTLRETGLGEEEAGKVYEKAKEEYDERLESKLSDRVEELFKEQKENMLTRIDSKLNDMEDSIETKQDLRGTERRKYVDDKFQTLKGKIEDLEDQLFSLRSREKSDYEELTHKVDEMKPTSQYKKILAFILILVGAIIITYSVLNFQATQTLLNESLSKALVGIAMEALLIVTGIFSIKFAKDIYTSSTEEIKGREQQWITE